MKVADGEVFIANNLSSSSWFYCCVCRVSLWAIILDCANSFRWRFLLFAYSNLFYPWINIITSSILGMQHNKCIVINWPMTTAIVVFRSMTDFMYLLNILLQVSDFTFSLIFFSSFYYLESFLRKKKWWKGTGKTNL